MKDNEKMIIPGCGNCNSFTRVCARMFLTESQKPTLAKEAQISVPGEIEGPQTGSVVGLVCSVANCTEQQKSCSDFMVRTEADNIKDRNI